MQNAFTNKRLKKINKPEKQSIYFMYCSGLAPAQIAEKFDTNPQRILKIVQEVHNEVMKAKAKEQAKQMYK